MNELKYSDLLNKYPIDKNNENFTKLIRKFHLKNKIKIVILDDDPTGIQTVHGCLLATNWEYKTLAKVMKHKENFFYILTNSRAKIEQDAEAINTEIINRVIDLNKRFNYKLIFLSRSDSTLRGHFPIEPLTIKKEIEKNNLNSDFPIIFAPSFFEAGRYTMDNVHYLLDKGKMIPVADTEFANDSVFKYKNSNLINYIIEKSNNTTNQSEIGILSIDAIRNLDLELLQREIENLKEKKYIIINSLDYYDLKKISLVILKIIADNNLTITIRSSSSFPKAISGIKDKKFLQKKDLIKTNNPGIIIVGSYVNKTTAQLNKLLNLDNIIKIELDANKILYNSKELLNQTLNFLMDFNNNFTFVLFTSRSEIRVEDKTRRLSIGKKISYFLVEIVKNLPFIPSFIIAKGGITSNDILTKGLKVQTAVVKGQIISGVPVLITDKDCRYPNLPYIIFPGNVGDENSLVDVYSKLR